MSTVRALLALCVALVGLVVAPSPAWAAGVVTVTVTGHGTVTGPGISCGPASSGDCSQPYADVEVGEECDPEDPMAPCVPIYESQVVELTASTGSNGYVFSGWTGCEQVSGTKCTITMDSSHEVTARYADVLPPSVTWSGVSGPVRGVIELAASAADNTGTVTRVDFRVRGVLLGWDTTAPYSRPFNTADWADGPATVQATAYDAAQNESTVRSTITIDNTAPDTFIDRRPRAVVLTSRRRALATFEFSAGELAQRFECRLDAGAWTECTSPRSYRVPKGPHTFRVRSTDLVGNRDRTPAAWTWTVRRR